jgi:hypothetical protein
MTRIEQKTGTENCHLELTSLRYTQFPGQHSEALGKLRFV